MKKIAIVILNWNGKNFLEKYLPSLLQYSSSELSDIIIADNGSTDGSLPFLKENYPQLRTIVLDKNYGFAGGYNKALKQIEAEFFLLLNSDIEVTPGWLEPLYEHICSDDSIAAVAPKIKQENNKDFFEYAGAAGGYIDWLGYPFCRGRILTMHEKDVKQYEVIEQIFWASGACILIRSKVFNDLDGFDDDFFAHMEEIDLCWRVNNSGHKITYVPQSQVYHVGGGTLPNNSPFKLYLNYRNSLFMLYKNLHSSKFIMVLLLRMVLDGVSAIAYILSGKTKMFGAVFKAHIHFYKAFPLLQKKRNALKAFHKKNLPTIFQESILINYFIKKNKLFSQLKF